MMENKSGMYPLSDGVLLHIQKIERKTAGGLLLPDAQTDRHDKAISVGTIVAMGRNAVEFFQGDVKLGDLILFARHAGDVRRGKDGETYRLIRYEDVYGITDGVWESTYDARISMPTAEAAA